MPETCKTSIMKKLFLTLVFVSFVAGSVIAQLSRSSSEVSIEQKDDKSSKKKKKKSCCASSQSGEQAKSCTKESTGTAGGSCCKKGESAGSSCHKPTE